MDGNGCVALSASQEDNGHHYSHTTQMHSLWASLRECTCRTGANACANVCTWLPSECTEECTEEKGKLLANLRSKLKPGNLNGVINKQITTLKEEEADSAQLCYHWCVHLRFSTCDNDIVGPIIGEVCDDRRRDRLTGKHCCSSNHPIFPRNHHHPLPPHHQYVVL